MATTGSIYNPNKKEEVYGYQTFYRELGFYICRLEQYERALKYFNEAVSKTPNDKRALMGRAWARSKAAQYEGALEDMQTALQLDPDDLMLLAPQALNTYLSCEFEAGLVHNTRLLPLRKKPDSFAMGVMHCSEAIENCIGVRAGRPLRDHFKIIRRLAWKRYYQGQKPYEPKSRYKKKKKKPKDHMLENVAHRPKKFSKVESKQITTEPSKQRKYSKSQVVQMKLFKDGISEEEPEGSIRDSLYSHDTEDDVIPPPPPFPHKPLQNYTTNIKNFMAEKYLDCMYLDKIFLENLIKQPGVRCINKVGTCKMLQAVKNGYKIICYKQELLRTRRPFYFIKYQEATSSGALKERQEAMTIKLRETAIKEASQLRNKIKEALQNKKLRVVLETAEKLRQYCDSKPKRILPDRDQYLRFVYDSVCQAHYDVKRLNPNQSPLEQEKRIYALFGIPSSREPSRDSVIEEFKGVFLDWRKYIDIYEERLVKATTLEELAWIYHELGRFYAETKQYEMSRVYARKCISEGIRLDCPKWVVNASMLITKVNICQQNRNDAKVELNKAIQVAQEIGDRQLENYLKKVRSVVGKIVFDDLHGPKILRKRENKIIAMLSGTELKAEAAHLFSLMHSMPSNRRMYVMPGVKVVQQPQEGPSFKERAARRQSIMPSAARRQTEDADIMDMMRQMMKQVRESESGAASRKGSIMQKTSVTAKDSPDAKGRPSSTASKIAPSRLKFTAGSNKDTARLWSLLQLHVVDDGHH